MDIEKLKAEFEQSECFKRLEHVAQYTFFEFGAYIKRTDVPADIEKKCGKLITSLLFSWSAWKEAKAQAVPEGFAIVSKKDLLELTIAINAVDLATHTESKTNEVREMWQQVALKLMALGTTQEPAND